MARAVAPPPTAAKGVTPLVISLPHGLDLGGVTSWAVRLANALAARARPVALIIHPRAEGQPAAEIDLHPAVRRIEPAQFPPLSQAAGDLSPYIPIYRDTVRELARASGGPIVLAPNILGDSYGLAAALCLSDADSVRVLAWQHTDSDYDTALLQRFEPMIARYVTIDERYTRALSARLPHRAADIGTIRHGVPVPASPPDPRGPLTGRPIRLIYTGRIEHRQKRIAALAYLADELSARGIAHELAIVGDGPAAADLDALLSSRPTATRFPAVGTSGVERHLRLADAFVLPSRFEGLCISRIEAMASGCVPIVTTANSGAATGIDPGVSGLFVDAHPDDDERAVAASLAKAVARFATETDAGRHRMALAAWRAAAGHFSLQAHADAVADALDDCARTPARFWRASWPCAFSFSTSAPGCSGSVPAHGPDRLRAKLSELHGRPVILHGAGRHTIELTATLAESQTPIVALADDNPALWGRPFLGWMVIDPARAAAAGATDVILSSWIHAEALWSRRARYEAQGIRVHRLYE